MLFNSFSFIIFFPVVVCLYYLVTHRWRPVILLLASFYFYMAFVPQYILILLFLIVVDYFLGQAIQKRNGHERKLFLLVSILTNIGTLFFFKYWNFFNENIIAIADFLHWNYSTTFISVALPLGLSFHVFQSLSYVIEVYRGNHQAEKNILIYALYVMFFPQLVAGPIERPGHLLPQLKFEHNFNGHNVRLGLERMLWGFFKKLVIADQAAVIVNYLYSDLPTDGPTLVLLLILFSYQIYCDFSGYSDIAIGAALVLGYNICENFNRPYAAPSIAEFWRRWHMSLTSWFRDYIYYPLGGSRVGRARWALNAMVVFLVSGLWHGAAWTFVFWGMLHGLFLIVGKFTEKLRQKFSEFIGLSRIPRVRHGLQVFFVFTLVSLSWVFFRAETVGQAWQILSHLGNGFSKVFNFEFIRSELFRGLLPGTTNQTRLATLFFSVILLELIQYYQAKYSTLYVFDKQKKFVRYGWYYLLILIILSFGYFGEQVFIYFQF